jgi:uncharacterized cupredoxin-like copper-binding protein
MASWYLPRVLLALSTGHKIGLIVVGAIFVAFAITSAFIIPRFRPNWPGRGLPYVLLATVGIFAAMLTAVIIFGREGEEAEAGAGEKPAQPEQGGAAHKVPVTESEFKIVLPKTTLAAGVYEFDAKNDGKLAHDLVIDGPGVSNEKTPVFGAGKSETLKVTLKSGTYDFYCSVPGHKQAGMDVKVTVS